MSALLKTILTPAILNIIFFECKRIEAKIRNRIAFNKLAANWEFDGWKFSERWWFKS